MGNGGFGSVHIRKFLDGTEVAMKVFHLKFEGALNNSDVGRQRLSIIIDAALALEYMHFGYSNLVVHCDIKPGIVLLDKDMVAHLSDFGIVNLLNGAESTKQTQTIATIGYMAPGLF
ncbi:hypothetical protein WN944_022183 [Citrus x changshan-huyou]|uniref:Protein kinase domain-containing protein n=1 Tax=Citrus x changshan-huyou TaxID=2935761 RepID=A0AAP0N404_9ROSI